MFSPSFSSEGRLNRLSFMFTSTVISFSLPLMNFLLIRCIYPFVVKKTFFMSAAVAKAAAYSVLGLNLVFDLVALWILVMLTVRRLHDIGLSGKFVFFWLILCANLLYSVSTGGLYMVASSIAYMIVSLAFCFWPSEEGDNKYGKG